MTKNWHAYELTEEEIEQAKRVEVALCHEINLMAREGIPVPIILAGIGTTAANLLTCQTGLRSVAPWFARQAEMIDSLTGARH